MAGADRRRGEGPTNARQAPLIRDATVDDAPAIARVHVESWRVAYRDDLPAELLAGLSVERRAEGWRQAIGDPRERIVVADLEGETIGFASVGPSRDEEGIGELYAIYLEPARFGMGVGRALMDAALDRLRGLAYREATLWVLDGNERAERFYRSTGWTDDRSTKTEQLGETTIAEVRYRRAL